MNNININRNIKKIVNFLETNDNKHGNSARNGDDESSQPMLRFMDNAQIDSVSILTHNYINNNYQS